MDDFAGRVAFVTGSGRGLGWEMARTLASRGAIVAIHDRSESAPSEFGEYANLDDAREKAGAKLAVIGDIGSPDAISAMALSIESALGPVDILINCAGGDIAAAGGKPDPNDALGVKIEDVRAMLDRNLVGTILMCQRFCPGMAERGHGAVVNIASVAAHAGVPSGVIYAVAKAGVVQYTRCLAAQLRPSGVRVNAISPGPTRTARFEVTRALDPAMMDEEKPLLRYGLPGEVADAVAFLASDAARFVTGQVLRVDGGLQIFAG